MKFFSLLFIIFLSLTLHAQSLQREFQLAENGSLEVKNLFGRVSVISDETAKSDETEETSENRKAVLTVENAKENNLKIVAEDNSLKILVESENPKSRIDLTIKIPARMRVRVETGGGEISISGNVASAEAKTDTGTIAANVPLDDVRYDFVWTESRPRFLSDVELEEADEKAGGKFVVNGKIGASAKSKKSKAKSERESVIEDRETADETAENVSDDSETKEKNAKKSKASKNKKPKSAPPVSKIVKLNFTTARGIVLLNVSPNEVPSDLREKPLTEAAKAIIKSGDSVLTEAIRRASPKLFGDYAKTLPPRKSAPVLSESQKTQNAVFSPVKRVLVRVTDINNRAIPNLRVDDFEVSEAGENREVLSVEPTTAPFNLVLLLDVSGSVDNYVDFIRKAARNFVNTVGKNDRIAIIIFNEDVKTISTFTTDKGKLSESLDTFDAGGGTAYYDALGYTLAETLRPLKGDRTAIVVLSDGDDNRSFLPFDSLLDSMRESGALVYPLYVPSGLIAASANQNAENSIDPLRNRFMALTSKAEAEGEKLAQASGGVYYSIRQLGDLQKAYDDIVLQLRTAYSVTFRSKTANIRDDRASPYLKVKIKRENSFVKLGSVVGIEPKKTSQLERRDVPFKFSRISAQNSLATADSTASNQILAANFVISPESFFRKTAFAPSVSNFQTNEITGEVEKINYKQFVNDNLRETKFENFDINKSLGSFVLDNGKEKIAVSRWISPKRTRSYPYERVYDTLAFPKRVTIIPVVKDEGLGGERDFLQWDTISLLSLLDVHVVLAYYSEATKNLKRNDQITEQKFDNNYILARLNEIYNFRGTAREWNERETKQLKTVFERAKLAYREISKNTKTYLHDETPLAELARLAENPNDFAEFSRSKSRRGQSRELQSIQPKEALSTDTKGGVTITNLGGGKYFFTCDETRVENKTLFLIEDKHSQRSILPSENDIKDGLLKMMVYTSLKNVRVGKNPVAEKSVLRLTSSKLVGSIDSASNDDEAVKFFQTNALSVAHINLIKKLFDEARTNKFTIILEHAETAK